MSVDLLEWYRKSEVFWDEMKQSRRERYGKRHFVYALVDPVTSTPKYVGISCSPRARLSQHISFARHPARRCSTSDWIADLMAAGHYPALRILESRFLAKDEAAKLENEWIEHLRARGYALLNRQLNTDFYEGKRFSLLLAA